jgi:hypothetical protein
VVWCDAGPNTNRTHDGPCTVSELMESMFVYVGIRFEAIDFRLEVLTEDGRPISSEETERFLFA